MSFQRCQYGIEIELVGLNHKDSARAIAGAIGGPRPSLYAPCKCARTEACRCEDECVCECRCIEECQCDEDDGECRCDLGENCQCSRRDRCRCRQGSGCQCGGGRRGPCEGTCRAGWHTYDAQEREWKATYDLSLPSEADTEVITPPLHAGDWRLVAKVVNALRAAGAKTHEHAGVHVHVDASHFNHLFLARIARFVWVHEPLIVRMLCVVPHRQEAYAKLLPDFVVRRMESARSLGDLMFGWYGTWDFPVRERRHESRKHGVNIHSVFYRNTIEYRWFNSSLDPAEIKAFVDFSCAISWRVPADPVLVPAGTSARVLVDRASIEPMLKALDVGPTSPAYRLFPKMYDDCKDR